ncbi:MAG: hypothetical protein E7643_02420 [Ruminococcaceae bacterium]|nr:hypothetical protein [Oscillospiraceae bacterium]
MDEKNYIFDTRVTLTLPKAADGNALVDIWGGFVGRRGILDVNLGVDNEISIGNAEFLPLNETDEYTLCIRPFGIGIRGRDLKGTLRGFSALLLQIRAVGGKPDTYCAPVCDVHGSFSVSRRMIHLCVFPNTTLPVLRRLVRLCGVLSYTHVVLEFWGMLRFDVLSELAWKNAYTKKEITPILREARALGMEPIPMINHLGHASACRLDSGKHVVLDQNPALQYLFTPDGWCWDIFSTASRDLLRRMRRELYELFGNGEFFHIGCDEAYLYSSEYYPLNGLQSYLRELTHEVITEGRRPILWGDMLVPYNTNADTEEKRRAVLPTEEKMRPVLHALHPDSVIADWHYETQDSPVRSSLIFKEAGFDVLGCPWDKPRNIDAHYKTATEHGTDGLMMTTWHTLHTGTSSILYFARKCGLPKTDWSEHTGHRNLEIATILRKLSPAEGISYADSGFCARQLHDTFAW